MIVARRKTGAQPIKKAPTKRAATQRPAEAEPEATESKAKLRTDRNGNPKRDRRARFN